MQRKTLIFAVLIFTTALLIAFAQKDGLDRTRTLTSFSPTFLYLEEIELQNNLRDWDNLLELLAKIENDNIARVLEKAEESLRQYTNTKRKVYTGEVDPDTGLPKTTAHPSSSVQYPKEEENSNTAPDTNNDIYSIYQETYNIPHPDVAENFSAIDKDPVFTDSPDYFGLVMSFISDSTHLETGLNRTYKAERIYNKIKDIAKRTTNVSEAEVSEADFRINLYAGVLNLYKGSIESLKESAARFNYLRTNFVHYNLNDIITETNKHGFSLYSNDNIMIMRSLAGINNLMIKIYENNPPAKKHYQNQLVHNLWIINEIIYGEGSGSGPQDEQTEKLYNYKQADLLKEYYTVLDFETPVFKNVYKPFINENMPFYYSKIDKLKIEKKDAPGATTATN